MCTHLLPSISQIKESLFRVKAALTRNPFSVNCMFTMDIFLVIINSIISAGCPITFRACRAMSSGCTVYSPGCKRFNYSAVIWCNDVKIAIVKKTAAAQEKEKAATFLRYLMPKCLFARRPGKSPNRYGWSLHLLCFPTTTNDCTGSSDDSLVEWMVQTVAGLKPGGGDGGWLSRGID